MSESIKLIIKGFIIGLGKILPGVSGAVLAMMFNVYEPALAAISDIKKDFYKNIFFLGKLGIGICLALIIGSKLLIFFLQKYYLQTMFLFVGIMLSGVKEVSTNIKIINFKNISVIVFTVILFITLSSITPALENMNIPTLISYFISGVIDAFSSVVPGISGTILLMLLGTYYDVLNSFSSILNLSKIFSNTNVLIPFLLGFLIGGYLTSKLVTYLFRKYHNITYSCIVGLIIGSLIMLLIKINIFKYNIIEIIFSIILTIIGYIVTKKVNI